MRSFLQKLSIFTLSAFTIILLVFGIVYKFVIPPIISSQNIVNFVAKRAGDTINAEIKIEQPKLKTGRYIAFTLKEFSINKDGKNLLKLANIDTLFSIKGIFQRKIIVRKMVAENIYADAYNLPKIFPQKEKKKKKKSDFIKIDFYNVLLGVKNCTISYYGPNYDIDFSAKHMVFDRTRDRKFLHFDFDLGIKHEPHKILVSANDMNKIFMENKTAYVKDFPIEIDKSKIIINAFMTNKGEYKLNISGQNFNASDISNIVRSDIFVKNGSQMLAPIKDINGNVDFDLTLGKNKTDGKININEVNFKVVPLLDIPVKITQGEVLIGNSDFEFKDFKGFYNNRAANSLKMEGTTKDYHNSCDTKILSEFHVTNDFFLNYLSKLLGSNIQLVGETDSRLILKSKNGSCDIFWGFKLDENKGFKFGEQEMVLKDYKTLFLADLSIFKNILKINKINYYISNELKRGITPLITIGGSLDMAQNMKILNLNLNMPRPLPSEFLNFIACRKIFKKGQVSGKVAIDNTGSYPTMDGEFAFDKVFVPAQRIYIRSANLTTKGDKITLKTEGRFRRSSYKFNGNILNRLVLPIIAQDVNLTVDDVDVERILTKPQNPEQQETSAEQALISTGEENEEDKEMPEFTKGLIIVENCSLDVIKGVYKEINFSDLHADMSLDSDGVLHLKSNKFNIANGTSTLRANADLVNRNYYMKLGIREVDSDIMATSILGMPRQISGKAKGLIELNADKSLKLNGDIKFKINNGTIGQIGYVEYILKVASLFRNPLAMISPSTVVDLVNIPDGNFDEISGEMKLKDNIIERMRIESTAPELATLIMGRYNLTTNDASLRVYTKFSDKGRGFASFLRNISLNTLASKLPISARNDSNYYSNELSQIPKLESGEDRAQVFLTKIDGDIINYNFLSFLKRIK